MSDDTTNRPPSPTLRHLEQLIQGLTAGVILVDPAGVVIGANPAALKMHGIAKVAELGATADDYCQRFCLRLRNHRRLAAREYPIMRMVAGESFPDMVVEVAPIGTNEPRWTHEVHDVVMDEDGGEPDCLALVIQDVSERYDAEARFEAMFQANPAPAVILRLSDQRFIRANTGFAELCGCSRDAIEGRHLRDLDILAQAERREHVAERLSEGKPVLVNVHNAPGLGNAMGNLKTAYHNKTPLIVTAGQAEIYDQFRDELAAVVVQGGRPVLDDAEGLLKRLLRLVQVTLADKASVSFDSLSLIEIPAIDGEAAAVGWVLHHEYEGAVPTGTLVKGLRLRAGNVQVGDHALLEELFPEPRFNAWSVGEVHVVDRRVVPNGRRDHFEQNAHFHNLLNHLTPTARDIARRCRTSSVRRKWEREFDLLTAAAEEELAVMAQGSVGRSTRDHIALRVEQALLKMSKVAGMDILADGEPLRAARVDQLRSQLGQLMNDTAAVSSPLARLPDDQRLAYEQFFSLVYECSANRSAAKALIDRIMVRLTPEA